METTNDRSPWTTPELKTATTGATAFSSFTGSDQSNSSNPNGSIPV